MPRTSSRSIDEGTLTKGQLRKLNALRRSVGNDIGERAFTEWLSSQAAAVKTDKNAELIAESLWSLVQQGSLKIRPGGYLIKRGHRRVIVEPVKEA